MACGATTRLGELHLPLRLDQRLDDGRRDGARVDDEVGRVARHRRRRRRPLLRAHVADPVAGREVEGDLVLVAGHLHAGVHLRQVGRPGLPGELPRLLDARVELLDVQVLLPGRVDGLAEREHLRLRRGGAAGFAAGAGRPAPRGGGRRRGRAGRGRRRGAPGSGLGEDEGGEEGDWTHVRDERSSIGKFW